MALVVIAVVCVPWMLLTRPLILRSRMKRRKQQGILLQLSLFTLAANFSTVNYICLITSSGTVLIYLWLDIAFVQSCESLHFPCYPFFISTQLYRPCIDYPLITVFSSIPLFYPMRFRRATTFCIVFYYIPFLISNYILCYYHQLKRVCVLDLCKATKMMPPSI